ncbi:MAG: hypothetical protein ABFC91_07650 [Methanobacteriaceae archaeon]
MFGMTRKQFQKKSSQALRDISPSLLLLMEITVKEQKRTITTEEARVKLDLIRKDVEKVFFEYEGINPPSRYVSLHLKIMQLLTHLQEVVNSNQEYLSLLSTGQEASQQLNESQKLLEKFREEFHRTRQEIELI